MRMTRSEMEFKCVCYEYKKIRARRFCVVMRRHNTMIYSLCMRTTEDDNAIVSTGGKIIGERRKKCSVRVLFQKFCMKKVRWNLENVKKKFYVVFLDEKMFGDSRLQDLIGIFKIMHRRRGLCVFLAGVSLRSEKWISTSLHRIFIDYELSMNG